MSQASRKRSPVVFLLDVDNTLLNNDACPRTSARHLTREVGGQRQERYWAIFEELRVELGYADYLGALQRYRIEVSARLPSPRSLDLHGRTTRSRTGCIPGALDAIDHSKRLGPTVILSDGDVVFQPRKVERSGLFEAVEGRVLIYIHKELELADVETALSRRPLRDGR